MSGKVKIVGVGPGHEAYILPAAFQAVDSCDVLIGGQRNLELFQQSGKEIRALDGDFEGLCAYLSRHAAQKSIAVLVSGDPGIFSLQKRLRQKLTDLEIETIPGVSSLQLFCSRLGMSWDDLRIISLHGRDEGNLLDEVRNHARVCVFTGGVNSPGAVSRRLQAAGFDDVRITVGERLSYPEERIVRGNPEQIGAAEFDGLAIMLIERTVAAEPNPEGSLTSGLPDECFRRGEIPMTKEEVRVVSLAKLRLRDNDIVYDIGAGTGSVTVEAALRCKGGRIYAVEKEPAALALVAQNVKQFGVGNVRIIAGAAPAALEGLPEPDRVFIGGSDGQLPEIIRRLRNYHKALQVVINAVTLETAAEALGCLSANGFGAVEAVNLAVSRSQAAGGKHLMKALNPVTIISAAKGEA